MNMTIPDFLINDSYDQSFYDNAYGNEQLNSINVLTGKNYLLSKLNSFQIEGKILGGKRQFGRLKKKGDYGFGFF